MKLYKLSQDINSGYDTYDSVVVCAEDVEDAKHIHPSEYVTHCKDGNWYGTYSQSGFEYITEETYGSWVSVGDIDKIMVEELGEANENQKKGIICASFNAG